MAIGSNSKKRFMDVHMWDNPWFFELSAEHQLFWIYMTAKCDNIGVYAHSKLKTSFEIRVKINESDVEQIFNAKENKVKALGGDKFLLIDFCKFQHCPRAPLLPKSKVFVSYMKDIRDAGLVEYFADQQPEVVSRESVIFFNAFKHGIIDFKYYSDSDNRKLNSGLTPYQEALRKAKKQLNLMSSESHADDIPMPSLSHQGKGTGIGIENRKTATKGEGSAKEAGTESGSGRSSRYYRVKDLAQRLYASPGEDINHLVNEVDTFAKHIEECNEIESALDLIEYSLSVLEERLVPSDLTFDTLKNEISQVHNLPNIHGKQPA